MYDSHYVRARDKSGSNSPPFQCNVQIPPSRGTMHSPRGTTNQKHYQELGSARHQYGISTLVTQTSFCEGSSGDLAKRRLFSQANWTPVSPITVINQLHKSTQVKETSSV